MVSSRRPSERTTASRPRAGLTEILTTPTTYNTCDGTLNGETPGPKAEGGRFELQLEPKGASAIIPTRRNRHERRIPR